MEQNAKYFPKTLEALSSLKETTSLLEESAIITATQKQELANKLSNLRNQVEDKAFRIDSIIQKLTGAIE
jgi:uncharacterized protein YoxC